MATYVNDLRLKEIATGDEAGTWGTSTNTNLELIAEAFSFGTEAITTNADTHTTTIADGSTDPGRSLYLKYTGTLDSACTITIGPNTVSKLWFIENGTSGSQNIIISQGSGANVTVPAGEVKAIYSDGAGSGAAMVDAFANLKVSDAAQTNITSLGTLTTLTVDDITINGSTISDSGDLTLDVGGDIILDADGDGEIFLKDGGTTYGNFYNSNTNFMIYSPVQDQDIFFQGNDGGSTINALILDMSNAGAATFNGNLTVNGADVTITSNIIHAGDSNTFFGFNDNDTFRVVTSGSEALRVASNQRVGIGTSSPDAPLHINGSVNSEQVIITGNANASRGLSIQTAASGGQQDAGVVFDAQDTEAGAAPYHSFETAGTEVMRIPSTGLVTMTHSASAHTGGLTLTNSQAGGFGSGLTFQSERSDNNALVDAARIRTEGASSWNSDSTTESNLIFETCNNNSLAERLKIANDGVTTIQGDTGIRRDGSQSAGELLLGGTTDGGFVDFDSTSLQLNTQRDPNTGTFVNTSKSHGGITITGSSADSHIKFFTASANNTTGTERMRLDKNGELNIGCSSNTDDAKLCVDGTLTVTTNGNGNRNFAVFRVSNENWNTTDTAMRVGRNGTTGRSINAGGTINASGADYAEYMKKADSCGTIAKGDVCGVDSTGKLTDVFNNSISFVIKSTDPSYVGGDTWGDVGLGLSDEQAEIERQKHDRIAFSGQVPVNITGSFNVGDYVYPQANGTAIQCVAKSNPTFEEYQLCVGKIWATQSDGRPLVAVKIG